MKIRLLSCLVIASFLISCSTPEPAPAATDTPTPSQPQDSDSKSGTGSPPQTDTPPDQPEPDPGDAPAQESNDPPPVAPTPPPPPPAPADPPDDEGPHPGLADPSQANEKAPDQFQVKFETTKGDVILQIHRSWAPRGADRFYNLVKVGFFTDLAVFRVIQRPRPFMAQFGIHGDPRISRAWDGARIQDDPVTQSNTRGRITFATAGPNTRTTQFFINYGNNGTNSPIVDLDRQGFSPFGEVIEGMEVVDSFYGGYGEGAPRGLGPSQGRITSQGNSYLKQEFDKLDYIKSAVIQ